MACVKEINSSRVVVLKVPLNDLKKERKSWPLSLALGVTSGPKTNLSIRALGVIVWYFQWVLKESKLYTTIDISYN